jgi:hypothetical protein
MMQQVDQGHSECQFVEAEHVFLHPQTYNKTSLKDEHCLEFTANFMVLIQFSSEWGSWLGS